MRDPVIDDQGVVQPHPHPMGRISADIIVARCRGHNAAHPSGRKMIMWKGQVILEYRAAIAPDKIQSIPSYMDGGSFEILVVEIHAHEAYIVAPFILLPAHASSLAEYIGHIVFDIPRKPGRIGLPGVPVGNDLGPFIPFRLKSFLR